MEINLCDLSFTVNERYSCVKVYGANTTISGEGRGGRKHIPNWSGYACRKKNGLELLKQNMRGS